MFVFYPFCKFDIFLSGLLLLFFAFGLSFDPYAGALTKRRTWENVSTALEVVCQYVCVYEYESMLTILVLPLVLISCVPINRVYAHMQHPGCGDSQRGQPC